MSDISNNDAEKAQLELTDSDRPSVVPASFLVRTLMKFGICKSAKSAIFIAVFSFWLLAFLPLVLLSVCEGTAWGDGVHMPLFGDAITLTRYLVVVPVLILSEIVTKTWMGKVGEHFFSFLESPGDDHKKLQDLIAKVLHFRSSILANLLVLALAVTLSIFGTNVVLVVDQSSWQATVLDSGHSLTNPGYWNAIVSQPLFRFVVLGWLFDYVVWIYFLYRVSKFPLKVIATHPDTVGGLSFVRVAQSQYCIAAFAFSCAVCGMAAQTVHYMNVSLQSFSNLGFLYLILSLIFFCSPLLLFTPVLAKSKLNGVFSYGELCSRLCHQFADRWLGERRDPEDLIVSSTDPSALADMNGSYQAVLSMKPSLVSRQMIVVFTGATLLPALPLVASVMPIKELLKQIFQALT